MTYIYNMQGNEMFLIIINWPGRERLQFIQTMNDEGQEKCKTTMGLFEVLGEKFKPQHSETVLSFKYYRLIREKNEKVGE